MDFIITEEEIAQSLGLTAMQRISYLDADNDQVIISDKGKPRMLKLPNVPEIITHSVTTELAALVTQGADVYAYYDDNTKKYHVQLLEQPMRLIQ